MVHVSTFSDGRGAGVREEEYKVVEGILKLSIHVFMKA